MALVEQARAELTAAINALIKRRSSTSDAAERKQINDSISAINDQLDDLDSASLLDAARAVATASDTLAKVLASARTGPFDGTISAVEQAIQRLQSVQSEIHANDGLAPSGQEAAPEAAGEESKSARKVATSKAFADLRDEYDKWFAMCRPLAACKDNIAYYLKRIVQNKPTYQLVVSDLGIPWHLVALIHAMECGFNFNTHLHNGDPLSARTVHVPAGRPGAGSPPFTWVESAVDALKLEKLNEESDWSIARQLFVLERYNGFGYRGMGLPTPYLWSFSNLYTKGKFMSDGNFDPEAVSKQCGAGVLLYELTRQKLI